MTQKNILIIGGGNMGSAIAEGLVLNADNKVTIKAPRPENCKVQREDIQIVSDFDSISAISFDMIVISVKPYMIKDVLEDAADFLKTQKSLLVSVAAGMSFSELSGYAPEHMTVIRSMPNTPVALGAGLWGYYAPTKNDIFEEIASSCGAAPYFPEEEMMHGFTALAGSGPAYIFHMIEALAQAGKNIGLSDDVADIMARQTVIGTSLLAQGKAEISAKNLRENVTSPNGTTQAGLEALMGQLDLSNTPKSDLTELMTKTLTSAKKRSLEMAK